MKNPMIAKIGAVILTAIMMIMIVGPYKKASASGFDWMDPAHGVKLEDIPDDYRINGFNRHEAAELIQQLFDNLGASTALIIVNSILTDSESPFWEEYYYSSGVSKNVGIYLADAFFRRQYAIKLYGSVIM